MSMMKELFTMLEEVEEQMRNSGECKCNECSKECKEDDGIDIRKCTNEAKGYHTIIPDEVFDKVMALMKAHDDLKEALVKSSTEVFKTMTSLPDEEKDYAMIEFMFFSNMVNNAWDKITDLVVVHEVLTKEDIDKHTRDAGVSLKQLIRMKVFNDMMEISSQITI